MLAKQLHKIIQIRGPTAPLLVTRRCLSSDNGNKTKSLLDKYFGPDSGLEKEGTKVNRWKMLIPACITHVCLGAPYGWSAVSSALTREQGKG